LRVIDKTKAVRLIAWRNAAENAILLVIMRLAQQNKIPAGIISDLENRFFWWEPVTVRPRSANRVIAQAMDSGLFKDIRWLETTLGLTLLADVMAHAEPGWFNGRSWEFWRGRLRGTGQPIPEAPPRRSL